MDNPYEAPSTRPLARESRRDLWRRQLICPHCSQPGVSAGVAYLAHPFLKVRCQICQGRSTVRLTGAARKRFVALAWSATIIGVATIAVMGLTDPAVFYNLVSKSMPWFWEIVSSTFGIKNQMNIVLAAMFLISVTPLVALLLVSARFSLRDIAYYSTLIHAGKSPSK